jgi:hypothetical protein
MHRVECVWIATPQNSRRVPQKDVFGLHIDFGYFIIASSYPYLSDYLTPALTLLPSLCSSHSYPTSAPVNLKLGASTLTPMTMRWHHAPAIRAYTLSSSRSQLSLTPSSGARAVGAGAGARALAVCSLFSCSSLPLIPPSRM